MSQTSIVQPFKLTHGTMLSRNLHNTRKYYEEYLGLEVVRHAKPAMMVRLHSDMYVVCVCIGERVPQQHVLTHWGLNVSTKEEVDQAYEKAQALKEVYGIRKIQSVRERHGAYGFYQQDLDYNWWEIQFEPRTIEDFFLKGDVFGDDVHDEDTSESHE